MTGHWSGLSYITISLTMSIMLDCNNRVAWSHSRSKCDVMSITNEFSLFCEAWWVDQVTSTGSSVILFCHSYSIVSCGLSRLMSGCFTTLWGAKGFFLVNKSGWTLMKESASSGTVFTFWSPKFSCPRSSPLYSLVGCWKTVAAVVAVNVAN